jgi:hypothetical protein
MGSDEAPNAEDASDVARRAGLLEWDDETPVCELWQQVRDLGLNLEVMDRTEVVNRTA